jgi:hypothetical protein
MQSNQQQTPHSFIAGGNAKWYKQTPWQIVGQFLTKLNIFSLYNTAIALLGFYPIELKCYGHTKTCIKMFIVAFGGRGGCGTGKPTAS